MVYILSRLSRLFLTATDSFVISVTLSYLIHTLTLRPLPPPACDIGFFSRLHRWISRCFLQSAFPATPNLAVPCPIWPSGTAATVSCHTLNRHTKLTLTLVLVLAWVMNASLTTAAAACLLPVHVQAAPYLALDHMYRSHQGCDIRPRQRTCATTQHAFYSVAFIWPEDFGAVMQTQSFDNGAHRPRLLLSRLSIQDTANYFISRGERERGSGISGASSQDFSNDEPTTRCFLDLWVMGTGRQTKTCCLRCVPCQPS
ncbi:hypothetical protein LZ30DRAFT_160228 [Colletotrichum cereale]|nr:hypothetical protein LZ30DRAFT_160228 [Colletotrichum cereale]